MSRRPAILQSEFPYNLSARCINREWFRLPMDYVWNIFCEELNRTSEEKNLRVHLFVLMTNHYHMIASTPDANISECMHQFGSNTSRRLTKAGNRINGTFGGRHFKTILQDPGYFLSAYKYNLRNPVTAGICERVENYQYSSFRQVMGRAPKKLILVEDSTFLSDPAGTLEWLNSTPDPKMLEAFRCGLKHQYFQPRLGRDGQPLIKPTDRL